MEPSYAYNESLTTISQSSRCFSTFLASSNARADWNLIMLFSTKNLIPYKKSESEIILLAHQPALFLIHDGIDMSFSMAISPSGVVGRS